MSTIGERLRAHWSAQGIKPPPGVSHERLREFETRFGVGLPTDMRECFLYVDGMGEPYGSDDDLFNFCPLSQVAPIRDLKMVLEDQPWYFVFADHSLWLPAYAIRLAPSASASHQVIAIESHSKRGYAATVVGLSFTEFVERYLGDEPRGID